MPNRPSCSAWTIPSTDRWVGRGMPFVLVEPDISRLCHDDPPEESGLLEPSPVGSRDRRDVQPAGENEVRRGRLVVDHPEHDLCRHPLARGAVGTPLVPLTQCQRVLAARGDLHQLVGAGAVGTVEEALSVREAVGADHVHGAERLQREGIRRLERDNHRSLRVVRGDLGVRRHIDAEQRGIVLRVADERQVLLHDPAVIFVPSEQVIPLWSVKRTFVGESTFQELARPETILPPPGS